jgi:diguanylate cyclase (GGDEF)-like protein/PAS domain S-box-containing protein
MDQDGRQRQIPDDEPANVSGQIHPVDFEQLASFAETLLSTPATLYRTLVEHTPAMTYLASPDDPGAVLFTSPQIARSLGYTPEEWLVDPYFWHTRLHPDDVERVLASDQHNKEGSETFSLEYRLVHRDGHPVWIRDQGLLIRDEDEVPLFWLGSTVDISEQKHAQQTLHEVEARYRTLVEQIPVVTYIEYPNTGGAPHFLSPQMESMLGYSMEQWRDEPGLWISAIHPDDRAFWQEEIERTDETGEPFNLEYRMIAADGRIVWIRSSSQLVRDDDGTPRFWQGILQDTTDEVIAEQRLAESEQRYRSLFDHNPDAVYSFDLDGVLVSLNVALEEMSGYTRDEVIGTSYTRHIAPEDIERVEQYFLATMRGSPQNYECGILRKDGSRIDVHVTNLPIIVGGEIVGVYGISKDISDRKALEDQLRHQAFHDPLTGLPNRLLFMDRLQHAVNGLKRSSLSIAVLFVDFDHFKQVNDGLGHEIGDQALIEIAGTIQRCIRPGDTASRLGGDEYTVLLIDVAGADEAVAVAKRLMSCFDKPINVAGHKLTLTASVGIVVSSSSEDDPGALLRYADLAMYQAKSSGKGLYEVFDWSHPAAARGVDSR